MKKTSLIIALIFLFFSCGIGFAGECPQGNKITQMTSNMESIQAVKPLDFSKITSAGALSSKNGVNLKVCLSNGNFTTQQMASDFVVPIKEKKHFIAVINFSNGSDPVTAGKYNPAAGYKKPFWVTAEVKVYKGEKNVIVSLGVVEGTAEILEITGDRVCGMFVLKNKKGDSAISGEFNVKLEKSRW
jgi:hypothetical protein